LVRGELDWIVMKCLEKDRSRRYVTANSLAHDIERYLHDEPVQACPPSAGYRFRKFARRNKLALAAAAAVAAGVLLAVVTLAASTVWVWAERQDALRQRDEARVQRGRAQASLRKARQAVEDSFTLVSESRLLEEPAFEPLRKELLQGALRYYQDFVGEHGEDPELHADLVAACFRITNMIYALADEEDWLTPFEKGVAVMEGLMRKGPDVAALQRLQGGIFRPMPTYLPTPKPAQTLRAFQKARALWEELVRAHPDIPGFKSDLAFFHGVIGLVQMRQDQHAEAAHSFRQARDLALQATASSPGIPHYRVLLGMTLTVLQQELAELGWAREAEEADRHALEVVRKLLADYPGVPYYQEFLAWTWGDLAFGRECLGQVRKEEEARREQFAVLDKLARAFPTVSRYRNRALWAQRCLAELLWDTGRRAEAAEVFRQLRDWTDRVNAEDAAGHDERAWFLANCPDPQFRDPPRAVELAKRSTALAPRDPDFWVTLGAAHYRAGSWQDAVQALTQAQRLGQASNPESFFLAMAHARLGHHDQARQWYDVAVRLMEKSRSGGAELRRFQAEAAALLKIDDRPKTKPASK
jgi:tetratricopeptide (TPR) repeat protein